MIGALRGAVVAGYLLRGTVRGAGFGAASSSLFRNSPCWMVTQSRRSPVRTWR